MPQCHRFMRCRQSVGGSAYSAVKSFAISTNGLDVKLAAAWTLLSFLLSICTPPVQLWVVLIGSHWGTWSHHLRRVPDGGPFISVK